MSTCTSEPWNLPGIMHSPEHFPVLLRPLREGFEGSLQKQMRAIVSRETERRWSACSTQYAWGINLQGVRGEGPALELHGFATEDHNSWLNLQGKSAPCE